MLKKIINKIKYKLFLKWNKLRLKNKDFTILVNNCTGGIIYHELGLRFNSPTINVGIKHNDFLNFVKHLKEYKDNEMIEIKEKGINYPIGKLINKKYGDIKLYFQHYNPFEEAKEKWFKRYNRINYDNLYVILDFGPKLDNNIYKKFTKLNIKNKISLVPVGFNGNFCKSLSCYNDSWHPGQSLEVNPKTGLRYLHEWDYIDFLNK